MYAYESTRANRALFDAFVANNFKVGQQVLERGIGGEKPTQRGMNAVLLHAGRQGRRQITSLVLEFGGEGQYERDGRLSYEAGRGNLPEIRRLASVGACASFDNSYALAVAVMNNRLAAARLLCDLGADIGDIVKRDVSMALEKAMRSEAYREMLSFVRGKLHQSGGIRPEEFFPLL